MAGVLTARRGRLAPTAVTGPPITDDFSGTFSTTKWAGTSYGVSNVAGRLQIPVDGTYPQAQTAAVFNLSSYPLWVEVPTVPAVGNGSKYMRFFLNSTTNYAVFYIDGNTSNIAMQLTGQATTYVAYSSTNHRWWRFRVAAGNLLWETAPLDKSLWTVQRTIAAPAWITGGLLRVTLDAAATGTEAASVAEFDNFNL